MKRIFIAALWSVAFVLTVVNGFLTLHNYVTDANDDYSMLIRLTIWSVVVLFFIAVFFARAAHHLFPPKDYDSHYIKSNLYRNTLEQPSELDSLGHKTHKLFGKK